MFKKKLAACILSVGLLTQSFSTLGFAASQRVVGDVNGDGVVNSMDYLLIKGYTALTFNSFPSPDGVWAADVNGDNKIDITDCMYVKKYVIKKLDKFPKDPNSNNNNNNNQTGDDRYFPAGTSRSELISKAATVKVSEEKNIIKKQVDEHWDVIQSVCGFKSKDAAYAYFFGMATRESTFRGETETGSESAHAFGPLQTAETAFANANPNYMPELDVPEMKQYDFKDDTFFDIGISVHMGIRHLLHFARLSQKANYTGKDVLRHALMGYNTGWVDGSSEGWIREYADETAALAGWYLKNNHMSDDVFTWTTDPRVDRSNSWSWY